MKIGLSKTFVRFIFQRTSHILNLKSLILMYYFIFFTIASLLGKKIPFLIKIKHNKLSLAFLKANAK